MKHRSILLSLLLLAALVLPATAALAQTDAPTLSLRLRRDWGYGGFANDIQGNFTMIAEGPDDLVSVQFLIDGELLAEDTEAPFETSFTTGAYADGLHELSATGTRSNGEQIHSVVLVQDFLSDEAVKDNMTKIIGPIIGVVLVFTLAGVLGPVLLGRKGKQHPVGSYSAAGAAICRQCGLPFSRHMMGLNLVVGKLERCPHCGKWQVVPRAWGDALVEAEARLRAQQQEGGEMDVDVSEEDRLRRQIDDSRFDV